VALRIPFMQIRLRGAERQRALRGNVVNIENDVLLCTESIPRAFDQTATVHVQLMRRMRDKTPYMEERIRPYRVYKAAKHLIDTELYRQEDVRVCEKWATYGPDIILHNGFSKFPAVSAM